MQEHEGRTSFVTLSPFVAEAINRYYEKDRVASNLVDHLRYLWDTWKIFPVIIPDLLTRPINFFKADALARVGVKLSSYGFYRWGTNIQEIYNSMLSNVAIIKLMGICGSLATFQMSDSDLFIKSGICVTLVAGYYLVACTLGYVKPNFFSELLWEE